MAESFLVISEDAHSVNAFNVTIKTANKNFLMQVALNVGNDGKSVNIMN